MKATLLGSLRLEFGDDSKRAGSLLPRKEQWLLAILVLRNGRPISRSALAGMLWAESTEEHALANLRRSLHRTRQAMGKAAGRLTAMAPRSLQFDTTGIECDLFKFEDSVRKATIESLTEACSLYSGELLDGCDEEWIHARRASASEMAMTCREQLGKRAIEEKRPSEAIPHLRALVRLDPLRESAHRLLMQALADDGNLAAAVTAYRDLRLLLRNEINQDPSSNTVELYQQIKNRTSRDVTRSLPDSPRDSDRTAGAPLSGSAGSASLGRIPRSFTSLIGRSKEIEQVVGCVLSNPLVTLTGPGGVGKTRIVIEAAQSLVQSMQLYFVELAGVKDSIGVVRAVSAAVGAGETVEDVAGAAEAMSVLLAKRPAALVLDNFEHLVTTCAELASCLLRNCPNLRILATGRQALRITGEVVVPVAVLAVPENRAVARSRKVCLFAPDEIAKFDAVTLFVDRARASYPQFELTADNGLYVANICARLDGLPLAIELAAARIRILNSKQIAERLGDRLTLLTGGTRTALPHHKTLRSLIDWSFDLLNPDEQRCLKRLSVFCGSFTLEMAEQVLPDSDQDVKNVNERIVSEEVLDLLTSLVDRNLVARVNGAGRYTMLETLREYAAEKLGCDDERKRLCQTHAEYYLGIAQTLARRTSCGDVADLLVQLEMEHDNVRAALRWTLEEAPDAALGLVLCKALSSFWIYRGYRSEGLEWSLKALDRASECGRSSAMAACISVCGTLAWLNGNMPLATAYHEQALQMRVSLGDRQGEGQSLERLGSIARSNADMPRAREYFTRAVEIATEVDDKPGISRAQLNLACLLVHTNAEEAYSLFVSAREVSRDTGDRIMMALAISGVAQMAVKKADYVQARQLYDEAVTTFTEYGDRGGVTVAVYHIGEMLKLQGQFCEARQMMTESLRNWIDMAQTENVVTGIEGIALLDAAEFLNDADPSRIARAVTLLSACETWRKTLNCPLLEFDINEQAEVHAAIVSAIGEEKTNAAKLAGQNMRLEDAADLACGAFSLSRGLRALRSNYGVE